MRITAPKKSGDAKAGQRVCRLFDELLPFLEAVGIPEAGLAEPVLPRLQAASADNFRTQFGRCIDREKVERWPRLYIR